MAGILDLDVLCLTKIFKFLEPQDLCEMRQCSRQLRDSVDDYCRSLYFTRGAWCHIITGNVDRILKNLGMFIRRLQVRGDITQLQPILLLDAIANNCGDILNGLFLYNVQFYSIDMKKFARVFTNLKYLSLSFCGGNQKCIEQFLLGHDYMNLRTLKLKDADIDIEILKTFFMRKRNIKKLTCKYTNGDLLPLIVLNAARITDLYMYPKDGRNLISVAQLRKLKRLEIDCGNCKTSIIALIKALSVNNVLEILALSFHVLVDEFFDALGNLTNLKKLRFKLVTFKVNDTKSIEMLGLKLSKLESLVMAYCYDVPYRAFLASACKSDKFRSISVCVNKMREYIQPILSEFNGLGGHRCIVSGNPLYIYLDEETFTDIEGLLTPDNLQSIEKNRNIKILRGKLVVFFS